MNIVVLERNSVGPDISVECFSELGTVTCYTNTVTMEEVRERVKNADIIVANKSPMCEESLKDAPNVKMICELATGYDNCDLEYCKSRGIRVTNVVDYCSAMVAQHTFTLALALSQKLPYYDNYVKSGAYSAQDRFSNFDCSFYELEGKTWGIVGMGNIGKRVARIATAFGCKVIFHSVTGASTVTEYPQVDKKTLLRESDFLSLHCPLSDLTRNFIDKKALQQMTTLICMRRWRQDRLPVRDWMYWKKSRWSLQTLSAKSKTVTNLSLHRILPGAVWKHVCAV